MVRICTAISDSPDAFFLADQSTGYEPLERTRC